MRAGQGRSSWRWRWLLGAVFGLLAGCAASRSRLEDALRAGYVPAGPEPGVAGRYVVRCPDVLQVHVEGRPDWDGPCPVGADGRIGLGEAGRLRASGFTPPALAATVAQLAHVPPEAVQVRVAQYNSQQLYVFGEVNGLQRAVPFEGPETVVSLLQRVGGLTPGAAPGDIQVVRPHVADGKPPEVFQVDLEAILLNHQPQTDLLLEPFDQVYIGQTRRSKFTSCFPPWLQPLYKRACGMHRRENAQVAGRPMTYPIPPSRRP